MIVSWSQLCMVNVSTSNLCCCYAHEPKHVGHQDEDTGHGDQLREEHSQSITGQPQDNHSPGLMTTQSEFINSRCIVLTSWLGEVKDVVAQHQQCNHGLHLPNNMWLLAVHDEQTSQASHHASCNDNVVDDLDDIEPPISMTFSLSTDATPPPSHPMHVATSGTSGTMPDGGSDPSQLQFYTPPIRDIIEWAKQISHCDVASVNSFPLHADFNRKAVEYMNEVIAEHRSWGLPIPKGRWPLLTSADTDMLYTMGSQGGGLNIHLRFQSWWVLW